MRVSPTFEKLKPEFEKAKQAFLAAQKIVIISHRSPDADAVGSNLALRLALESMGKEVISACVDPPPENSMFLENVETYVDDFDYDEADLIVSVDCGDPKLVVFQDRKPGLFDGPKPFINFDHHFSNKGFGSINPVDHDACSTCIIMYYFFNYCAWPITRSMATCLLQGIYFDTGGMMHSNTSAEVLEVCGKLMSMGANLKKISKELFHTTGVNKLRLWGRILERAYINEEGVTVSAVNTDDYEACEAGPLDTGGAIDYLNAVPGAKYSVLLSEDRQKGIVKGSLRTQREDVNLSDVASQWGGGGHPKASGFGMNGRLKPMMSWQVETDDGSDGGISVRF